MSFPLDLPQYLTSVSRTEEIISEAESKLALPNDQLKHAQFWFVNQTPQDSVAFNHLLAGDMDKAIEIWTKKDCVSSLQNRIVCALMKGDYNESLNLADQLYCNDTYTSQFIEAILGNIGNVPYKDMAFLFLDNLSEEVETTKIISSTTKTTWKKHLKDRASKPLYDTIFNEIEKAKATRGKDANKRWECGHKLYENTKKPLTELKALVRTSDTQYRMVADKLGLEILQCGIDYYNNSNDADSARKAMVLQNYAMTIVLGQMAKDRCKENVDILKKIIATLPPQSIAVEDGKIQRALRQYCNSLEDIETLLNNAEPILRSIATKLGKSNSYYRNISTKIVEKALSTLIDVVNRALSYPSIDTIRTIEKAWKITLRLDKYDIEADYKYKRYNTNREKLEEIVCTIKQIPQPESQPKQEENGCLWSIIIIIVIILSWGILNNCSQHDNHYSMPAPIEDDMDSVALNDTMAIEDNDYNYVNINTQENQNDKEQHQYAENRLNTGSRPYSNVYGKGRTGNNYLIFNTCKGSDYIIIVKTFQGQKVVSHIYINGGDTGKLFLPNGKYSIYFYSGHGWDPNKRPNPNNPKIVGGFVYDENIQKDEPISLYDEYGEYTLYPVKNGNTILDSSNEKEVF